MEDLTKLSKKELLERLAKQNTSFQDSHDMDREMAEIDRRSIVSNPHRIPFTETSDHKNVMLYTALNKKVGPLHPDNAKRTIVRWKKAGIQLFTAPRTQEQVEAFKQTDEYKTKHAEHLDLRKKRRQQSSKGRTEKMIKDIAVAVAGAKNG